MRMFSKPLRQGSESAFVFTQAILAGDASYGLDIDLLSHHPDFGEVLFEMLRLDPKKQFISPAESHPNRYWHKNRVKFWRLWELSQRLGAHFVLINYVAIDDDPDHHQSVGVIDVLRMTRNGIVDQYSWDPTFAEFQVWYREFNQACGRSDLLARLTHPQPVATPAPLSILQSLPDSIRRTSSDPRKLIVHKPIAR